jgi:hypothetical protein
MVTCRGFSPQGLFAGSRAGRLRQNLDDSAKIHGKGPQVRLTVMQTPGLGTHIEWPLKCFSHGGTKHLFSRKKSREETQMKYLFAWGLGVPGVLIVAWFLMSHH